MRNTTRDKTTQKKLYFNKEILPIGFVPCTLKDNIKIIFSTKTNDQDVVPFASFDFVV